MRVAITGEGGFLGYHLTQYLKYNKGVDVVELSRNYQSHIHKLQNCDWLIHCAGKNRGDDVRKGNVQLAKELVDLLNLHRISINIVFTSSIQEDVANEYGESKKAARDILQKYCDKVGTTLITYKLPNLFGPFGKPNYNSVVSTFCYNINNGIECKVGNATIDLCYVYDAAKVICDFKDTDTFPTTSISIDKLHSYLEDFHNKYKAACIPKLEDDFEVNLFNTYRSYSKCSHTLVRHEDSRGYLIELMKSGTKESQVFFSTTHPGITRGNHFHFNKIERFCILKGTAKVSMRKVGTDEIISYIIEEGDNTIVDMPVLFTHNLTNIGTSDLLCVFWVNEIFNKDNPDTYPEIV